jgi:hypothetical protein
MHILTTDSEKIITTKAMGENDMSRSAIAKAAGIYTSN